MDVFIWIAALAILYAASIASALLFGWTSKKIAHREGKISVKTALLSASLATATISLLLLMQSCATRAPPPSDMASIGPPDIQPAGAGVHAGAAAPAGAGAIGSLLGGIFGFSIVDPSTAAQGMAARGAKT